MENLIFCAMFWGNRDHPKRCSVKKVVLRNLAKLTRNNTCAIVSKFLTPSQVFRVDKNAVKSRCDLKYA